MFTGSVLGLRHLLICKLEMLQRIVLSLSLNWLFPIEFYVIRSFRRAGIVSASIEYGKLIITGDTIVVSGIELTVCNPSLGIKINLSLRKKIPFLFAIKIARIIQDDHFIAILFTDSTGRIKTCTHLRVYSDQVESFNFPNAPLFILF